MKFLVLLTETDHFAQWDAADAALRGRVMTDQAAAAVVLAEVYEAPVRRARGHPAGPTSTSTSAGPCVRSVAEHAAAARLTDSGAA